MKTQPHSSHYAVLARHALFNIISLPLALAAAAPDLVLAQDPNSLAGKKICGKHASLIQRHRLRNQPLVNPARGVSPEFPGFPIQDEMRLMQTDTRPTS